MVASGTRRRRRFDPPLPFSPVRNSEFLSGHWLEHRLPLEPEWNTWRGDAEESLRQLLDLWREQRNRIDQLGNEAELERAFIQPVITSLGWHQYYQTYLRGRGPDYALFESAERYDAALSAGRTSPDFWNHATLVADAKAWHESLDRPKRVEGRREYPPEQIEWYLNNSQRDYGILTNGQLWRLIPRNIGPGKPRFQTYLEVDLPRLLDACADRLPHTDDPAFAEFLRFYLLFNPRAFRRIDDRTPLIKRAIDGSSEYRVGVGEDLKGRVFEALRLCIEGFINHAPNELSADTDLPRCREQSFILLYRLLFIMYAEDRGLLPYRINATYTNNRSLGRLRDDAAARLDRAANGRSSRYSHRTTGIWDDLVDLFDLIDRGHRRYDVPPYNGGLFDPAQNQFLGEKKLPDRYIADVIDQLGRADDPQRGNGWLVRVDYRDLAIQHLGSIYEGLLEMRPRYANVEMVVVRQRSGGSRRVERTIPASRRPPPGFELTDTRHPPNSVYLETDKGERRSFGSYYTPDHIVDYIVENTLGPLCRDVHERLQEEITDTQDRLKRSRARNREVHQETLARLRADYDDRVLRLRVCDPAMGSGHFLVRACQYLAEEIATNPNAGDPHADDLPGDEPTLTYWKRRVAESCIYGVDINPLAVELAKLALWLETVAIEQPLTFLDHHLRTGNSLVGARVSQLGALPHATALERNAFKDRLQQRLPILLQPLFDIRDTPSVSADQIKQKDRLYRRVFQPVSDAFRSVADLWCGAFFADSIAPDDYQAAVAALTDAARARRLARSERFARTVRAVRAGDIACFHWELEFPEVFFDRHGRRDGAGFDAVIGNPPYDVLSERELERDLSAFKSYIAYESLYEPSRHGKNNLYKLFICRALDLLAENGRLGFIVPMAFLGDMQSADLRRAIASIGAFTSIDAFPQKDDPRRRVFSDAKLSTAVFTLVRTPDGHVRATPFRSQVHPSRWIASDSPGFELSTETIPLYDPSNFTIVSCSQADWEIAVKIIRSGRMQRLGQFVEFSQGEVNETNERRRGALTTDPETGRLVTRGANICLYVPREASQGDDLFINVARFLEGKGTGTKAYHHCYARVAWQESSPQNNFRRIIAAMVPQGDFCNHKVNYVPEHQSRASLEVILALLNSKLADWYFRLGSTNAAVSHYQLANLPFPKFNDAYASHDDRLRHAAEEAFANRDLHPVALMLQPALEAPPFASVVRNVIVAAVRRIMEIERGRGEIPRIERSSLALEAQPYQDLLDGLFYRMAGLTDDEIAGLEERLQQML